MLKKIILLIFCLALFCAFTTSCDRMTDSEKFFRMYEDMSALPEAEVTAQLDFDLSDALAAEGTGVGDYASLFGDELEGSFKVEGGYSLDENQSYGTVDMELGDMDGEFTDFIVDDGDTYVNMSHIMDAVTSAFSDLYESAGLTADEITQAYADAFTSDYMLIEGEGGDSGSMKTLLSGTFEKVKEKVLSADPELITEENGEYTLSVDGETATDLIITALEDIQDNAGDYADAINAYTGSLGEDTGLATEEIDEDSLSDAIDEIIDGLDSADDADMELTMSISFDKAEKEYDVSIEISGGDMSFAVDMTVGEAKYDGPSIPDSYMTVEEFSTAVASVDLYGMGDTGDAGGVPEGDSGYTGNTGTIGDLEGNGLIDTVYTYGYSTLLYPDLTNTYGLVTYTLTDSYGYTAYLPVIDGGTVTSDYYYVDAMYDSAQLHYELVDGTGYYPSTYMVNYIDYLYEFFAADSGYTDISFSDIYVDADDTLALMVTYYYYNGEPYYDIIGVAYNGSSELVYFDFIYMENYISSDMYTQIDTILSFTGAW